MNYNDIEYLRKELVQYIKILGHFPSQSYLKSEERDDLIQAIRNAGGVDYVAAALNVPTYNRKNGLHDCRYWTIDRITDEYLEVISKHELKEWPSPADLRAMGYGALAAAIGVHAGGHISFRKKLIDAGIKLAKKPRKLDHLQPFETIYTITDVVLQEGELKYYFLGLVAADGTIVSKGNDNSVELCLCEADVEILEKLRDLISPERPIHDKPSKVKKEYLAKRLKFNSKPLVDMVAEYMTTDNKSRNLKWPDNIPDKYLRHFIRGYFDGDGTVGISTNQREFLEGIKYYYIARIRFLGTEDFLKGLTQAIEKQTTIPAVKVQKKGKENVYCLTYTGVNAKHIHRYMYTDATIYLKRKAALWKYIIEAPADELSRIYGTEDGKLNKRAKEGKLNINHDREQ
ncbi:MAG TPA: hypothetical protein P5120_17225 [Spirochaetota bacterium]|nr:hypothetical protein [Spirochaetota bacterium]HRX49265.1 hypothetical protein [Spirochaetota bacterium]